MKAARAGHLCTVQFLISKGASLTCNLAKRVGKVIAVLECFELLMFFFLLSCPGANVNRATANNDHTVVSLACAGGHLAVVELLLAHGADPTHRLKVNPLWLDRFEVFIPDFVELGHVIETSCLFDLHRMVQPC